MNVIAREAVTGAEASDACSQRPLLASKTISLRLALGELNEEVADNRGDRRILLSGFDSRAAVGLIVHSNCDVLHSYTVAFVAQCGRGMP